SRILNALKLRNGNGGARLAGNDANTSRNCRPAATAAALSLCERSCCSAGSALASNNRPSEYSLKRASRTTRVSWYSFKIHFRGGVAPGLPSRNGANDCPSGRCCGDNGTPANSHTVG